MNTATAAWLILLLPLFSAVLIGLGAFRSRIASAVISVGAVVGSFLLTLLVIAAGGELHPSVIWLAIEGLQIDIGLQFDTLSKLMLCVVTGVGGLIHVFSLGYMKEDRDFSRYFAFLSLFVFSMIGIVLADNFVMMFIFWELVGISSYLLIGFWFEKPSAADAAKKAFLTNRVGDFGFLLGILMVWTALGSVGFADLAESVSAETATITGLAGFLIFCGAMGKSAQFPLHVWLPDAMEGPTPVSALIHAATMVAAGVYMLCRVFFLIDGTWAMEAIAWIGGLTSLMAALMAVQQDDIKRILAYSTLSQLGYMVMAVGLGGHYDEEHYLITHWAGPDAAMFHLTTHASFKALLFLGAGSVIVALHHEQDIWKMGGLRDRMPRTYWTFLIGTMALCGVPLFSGFFSKEAILDVALKNNILLFFIALLVALLTTFYMTRLFVVAFMGKPRSSHAKHAKESPAVMTVPLLVLAVPSVIAGYFNAHAPNSLVLAASLVVVVFGMLVANTVYSEAKTDPLPARFVWLAKALRGRFWFDEMYQWLIDRVQENLAKLAETIDRRMIAGLMVRGTHGTTELVGRVLRLAQTGNLQTYAFWFTAGMALVLIFTLG